MSAESQLLDELELERLRAEKVMCTGTIKFVDNEGGWGVISPDEGDTDLVFRSARIAGIVAGPLSAGVRVVFEVDAGPHGLQAYRVDLVPSG